MKTRYKYRVIILLAGIILLSFTKDERDIIGRINNTYSNFKNISMDIECKVYSNNGKKLEVSYKGVYKKQGYMIYHDLMDNLQISNTNGQMILDRNNKFISISTKKRSKDISPMDFTGVLLDTLIKYSVKHNKIEKGALKGYEFFFNMSEVRRFAFYYDENYLLNRVQTDVMQNATTYMTLELKFTNINTNPRFSLNEFSTDNFFIRKNDKITLNEKYKGYKLIQ